MSQKFNPANALRLISEERRQVMDPDALVKRLGIRATDTLADIGCGPGFFTVPLAKLASKGTVWALDVQPEMLDHCRQHVAEAGLTNVKFAHSAETSLPLDEESLDGAFCAFVLHEVENQHEFLYQIYRSLAPGGWLCILEWEKKETPYGPSHASRLTPTETASLLRTMGFVDDTAWSISDSHYAQLVIRGS